MAEQTIKGMNEREKGRDRDEKRVREGTNERERKG